MLYDALSQWWGELEHPTPSAEQQKRNASFFRLHGGSALCGSLAALLIRDLDLRAWDENLAQSWTD